jgi:predicted RNA-binding protein with PIN domain
LSRDILVDGYNVIKCAPSFQAVHGQSLALARARLITLLVNRYRHTPHQVIVVFDGDASVEQMEHDRRIRIIYSRYGETADSVLARLAASAREVGREVEIYSNDLEVQQSVSTHGGFAQSASQLERQVYAAPRDVERRTRHRIAMRRKYGFDPNYNYFYDKDQDQDNNLPPPSPGKKKKKRR